MLSYAALFVAIALVAVGGSTLTFAIGLCLYNFFYSFVIPFQTAWVAESERTGATAVLVPGVQGIGVSIGPILAGLVIGDGTYTGVVVLSFLILALSFVIVLWLGDPLQTTEE